MISTTLLISILGTFTAITVSIVGAWYVNHNNIRLQTRKLKEDHYVSYIEALHGFTADNINGASKYVLMRDKLVIIASQNVVDKILLYEKECLGVANDQHDVYLTELIKSIRKDLKITDKHFPQIGFLRAN